MACSHEVEEPRRDQCVADPYRMSSMDVWTEVLFREMPATALPQVHALKILHNIRSCMGAVSNAVLEGMLLSALPNLCCAELVFACPYTNYKLHTQSAFT